MGAVPSGPSPGGLRAPQGSQPRRSGVRGRAGHHRVGRGHDGRLTGSVGLLGDALHNLADVSTSLVVFVGFRVSKRPATPTNPYGYERAEDMAGLGVALAIWASAFFAGYVSVHKLAHHGHTTHLGLGIAAAAIGIAGNQAVARYKARTGRRIQSATLVADAHHSLLDALSSAGAMLGLIGVALGLPWADGVAGLVVTGLIIRVGWEVTSEITVHLMDGIDPETLVGAESAALAVDGVEHVHVRGRWLGRSLVIEVEGYLGGATSLELADQLGQRVREAVRASVPEARAVVWSPHALPG
ncbi:MAG TPA: cation diffusion facilitator family transporter [Acidimicrobiales bacterium]|nr:cation diffusion facilitator family transporter [Acidimicrobiales bacterium]